MSDHTLPSIKSLLTELLDKAKKQWKTLVIIAVIPWGVFIASAVLLAVVGIAFGLSVGGQSMMSPNTMSPETYMGQGMFLGILALVFAAINMLASFVGGLALIYATLHPDSDVRACYLMALKVWKSLLWVSLIAGFVLIGGTYLFVIPGLVVGLMLAFAEYVALDEGKKGMDALMRSRELVKGRGWSVLFVLIVMGIVIGIPSLILGSIADQGNEVFGFLSSAYDGLVAMPLYVLAGAIVYHHAKKLPSLAGPEVNARNVYKGLGILGVVGIIFIVPAFIFIAISVLSGGGFGPINQENFDSFDWTGSDIQYAPDISAGETILIQQ